MIHQYKNKGYNIVLDVNSGSVHVVDDIVYDLIHVLNRESEGKDIKRRLPDGEIEAVPFEEVKNLVVKELPQYHGTELMEAYEEVSELIMSDMLFSDDIYEAVASELISRETVVKALCLHVAHDCNLACRYCFAEEGEYHGKRELMSFETGKKAIDFLVENSGARHNLEIDFFGGEPLMNFEVVKQLVEYGRSIEESKNKKFRFTITTNGILLDEEKLEYINKEMGNLVLSIDGRKEVHDRMRPSRGGKGSYDIIVPKFQNAAESRNQDNYYVRGTYTRYNTDFAEDVMHLADLGFEQISMEPVVADPKEDYALREEDIPFLLSQYDVLADYLIKRKEEGKGVNFFHFMIDLSGGPCVYKRISGCGSGTEYLAVAPSGELYPCHQFVGQTDFIMGNVDEGVTNTDLRNKFKKCNVYSKEDCKNCFSKFYCSGGCAANAYNYDGDINGSYKIGCELQRKRVESAILLKVIEADKEGFETGDYIDPDK